MKNNKSLPLVIITEQNILPGMTTSLTVSGHKTIRAIEEAMMDDEQVLITTTKNTESTTASRADLYPIGVVAQVRQIIRLKDDSVRIIATAIERSLMGEIVSDTNYTKVVAICYDEDDVYDIEKEGIEAMKRGLLEAWKKYFLMIPDKKDTISHKLESDGDLGEILDTIASRLSTSQAGRQAVIEAVSITERYELVVAMLLNEANVLGIKKEFQQKVKEHVDKNQKEYLLREQQKVIREELGESNTESEADEYKKATEKLDAPEEVKEKLKKEINRFLNLPASSSESGVVRGYIETLLGLPWNKASVDNKDLKKARKIISRDHYGMEKVKDRMLEFLAVRNLTGGGEAPIICLVGPPGVGKTSIARSVAESLDKKYVRICLGGVRDEAEIRGHRKTYVGAMPGRIINALSSAKVNNPLILLDEIDKVSNDYKGDTHSALLEVLDSEQNSNFIDHYVELPVDLSNVLFIATANSTDTIPRPLLDRMEIIEVTSYTSNEKAHIAKEHLIPKQIKKHGLKEKELSFSQSSIDKMIMAYTKESGVRGLERRIAQVARKVAREIYENEAKSVRITKSNLTKYLGQIKYQQDKITTKNEIGIVTGLAWTSVGGVTLEIEVATMPGKGEMKLTGQLGDVMKESASAALTYVRSVASKYGVNEDYFSNTDIHIHIPEGAVPKDGPSAGVTMATAILSAVSKIPARCDCAMTGEITLRGRVLPIGGLKEKLLAAKNAGIKTVFIPADNAKDLEDISGEILDSLDIVRVSNVKEIMKIVLIKR